MSNGSYDKLSAQSPKSDREPGPRDARGRIRLDADPDWAAPDIETYLDKLSPVDMSNKENTSPSDQHYFAHFDSHPDRGSQTPSPPGPNPRDTLDSHDLSLSPRNVTRDSLLGNMLLSLDQFSMGQMNCVQTGGGARTMSGFAEPAYYYEGQEEDQPRKARTMTSTTQTARSTMRPRGPSASSSGRGHGYSYSSDYEPPDDPSRMPGNVMRGRKRSNSSSTGFQTSLGRINSLRDMTNQRATAVAGVPIQRPLHSRGGRGSKSSSTNSIDMAGYAQVLGSQRWAASGVAIPKRSSSLEITRPNFGTQPPELRQQQQQHQPWHIELPNSFFNYSTTNFHDNDLDDAAPTPTVPIGPRRLANMPSMPSFARPDPMGEPLSPVRSVNLNLERKRSTKSNHTHYSSSRFSSAREREAAHLPPPLPASGTGPVPMPDLDSAPAPHVGYEKAKEPVPVHAQPAAASPVSQPSKEKQPGFFRRMFGGGSKTSSVVASLDQSAVSTNSPTIPSVVSPASPAPANTMNNTSITTTAGNITPHQAPPAATPSQANKSNSNPPSRQTNSSHGLQKKPSGFFRRRKKSVSVATVEAPPLPPSLPPSLPPPILPPADLGLAPPKPIETLTPRPVPSPVTSLRKAMDPYLKASEPATPSGRASPSSHRDDLALSVYHSAVEELNSPADRVPRSFSPDYEPDPRATIREVPADGKVKSETRRAGTPAREISKLPYTYERTGSFLHDNSESEASPPRVRKQASQPTMGSRSRSPNTAGRATLAPGLVDAPLSSPSSNTTVRDKKLDRLTQESMSSEKSDRPSSLTLPIEGVRTDATLKARASVASIPSLRIETSDATANTTLPKSENPLDEPEFVLGDPTEDDKVKAKQIYHGSEEFIPKEKAASWMGEEGPIRQRTLRAYIELYDFTNKSIITSLRDVCNRLILKGETQQVDRILVAFSKRWCDCNPNHGFKSMGEFSSCHQRGPNQC